MPVVIRGAALEGATTSTSHDHDHDHGRGHTSAPTSPSAHTESRPPLDSSQSEENDRVAALRSWRSHSSRNAHANADELAVTSPTSPSPHSRHVVFRADSNEPPTASPHPAARDRRRSSLSLFRHNSEDRPEADAYYDSRAATKREWRRRATTLQHYYDENPELLPQLPFTWHRGWKRWKLIFLVFLMWVDACAVPIALYYGFTYAGEIEGWITFAVVTTLWGGPTYVEFGVRTIKLMKKERFYRPLGTNSRWCFDYLNWTSTIAIFVVTALFIVGSAPHEVWLRVLCMPMPAMLYALAILTFTPTLYCRQGWKAPFRLSSTGKGEPVKPAVYYFIEDTVAVNANAGRPYREALAARYDASPRFREMLYTQSMFWSIPAFILAIPLTIIAVIPPVPPQVAYAFCKFTSWSIIVQSTNTPTGWAIPFIWAAIWGLISLWWCKKQMIRERVEWEHTNPPLAHKIKAASRGLDTETSSATPPPPEDRREIERDQEEIARLNEATGRSRPTSEQMV